MSGLAMLRSDEPEPDSRFDLTVGVHDARWNERLPDAQALCERCMRLVLEAQPERWQSGARDASVEAACILTDDAEIHELNLRFRGKDAPTNVLAFPAAEDRPGDDSPLVLGDVIVSLSTLEREARAQGKTLRDHAAHMVIHGTLHLLGFDHLHDGDAERMEAEEIRLLMRLGIDDPYRTEEEAPSS